MVANLTIEDRNYLVKIAELFIDTPYQFGGNGSLPNEPLDCSRFTQLIYGNTGITLERASFQQGEQCSLLGAFQQDIKTAEIGDLIFFKKTFVSEQEITHVGIYIGDNKFIHAGSPKVSISRIDGYRKIHFKGIGKLSSFAASYNKSLAKKNYERIKGILVAQKEAEILKAVNAVIAVLTSTRSDLPENFQEVSASYAKSLRETYPKARKLEKDQEKKVYQALVDFLSYAYKYAGEDEQKKYSELAGCLRKKYGLL